ncbi:DNA adenine methylase [Candidatus Dependentiae bacterium]|nr:DNA adenine methylase [Candidatus Dependentiae bacterium]
MKQLELIPKTNSEIEKLIIKPKGYKGFYAFHKYWGKKPYELISYLISNLSSENSIILDPFVGSGVTVREAIKLNRKVIGIDINPFCIDLTKTILAPPDINEIKNSYQRIENKVKEKINSSYRTNTETASHYLWEGNSILEVWYLKKRNKTIKSPDKKDFVLIQSFDNYKTKHLSKFKSFHNSRINTKNDMNIYDIFTKRALRNIDLLIDIINEEPQHLQLPLKLCLTAASGQMSKMVFAIMNRSKNKKKKIEVGSWVIGYWKPKTHFEINVWNCFERRLKKLIKAIYDDDESIDVKITSNINKFFKSQSNYECLLLDQPCQKILSKFPNNSIDLIVTDPPHSDRIPYLELSSMWNTILGHEINYDDEIVVSNAKERDKTKDLYKSDMINFVRLIQNILSKNGVFVLIFNAKKPESWEFFDLLLEKCRGIKMNYIGYFPCAYSARSVVQDNRKGGLTHDLALIFSKGNKDKIKDTVVNIPKWSFEVPEKGYTEK